MAKETGGVPTSGLKLYGEGTTEQQRNPFMPLETSYEGGPKGVVSNRGSNFALGDGRGNENSTWGRLEDKQNTGLSGKMKDDLAVNDEGAGSKKSGKPKGVN